VRGDSQVFLNHFKKFFDECFFPGIEGIHDIIIAGDFFDRRKYINFNTAKFVRENFWDKVGDKYVYLIPGNHDIYNTNNLEIDSLTEMIPYGANAYVLKKPTVRFLEDFPVLFLPWICSSNQEECLRAVKEAQAPICVAHLHLAGFEIGRGVVCTDGMDHNLFNKFDLVMTGHFHHKHQKDNILYLGSPYQMTWADYDDPRGFHIFDTETRKCEFIKNPFEMFQKIVYDDMNATIDQVMAWDFTKFEDVYVKVIVKNKTNPYWFDLFVEELERHATDVKIVEELSVSFNLDDNPMSISDLDTITILKQYVQEADLQVEKSQLNNFLITLYNEALSLEN
jgi:DNA repair exonuclease SbcCD nuclease subunit